MNDNQPGMNFLKKLSVHHHVAFIRDARYIDSIFAQYLHNFYIIIIIVAADIVYLIIIWQSQTPFSFFISIEILSKPKFFKKYCCIFLSI